MSPEEAKQLAEVLGQILNGNAVGFFVMVAALGGLAYAVKRLWAMVEKRLADCERQHEACQKESAALSQALIDLADGKRYEARARAQTMMECRVQTG